MVKRRRPDVFGPYSRYIANLPCLVCRTWPSEPHHVRSRGAGGTDFVGHGSHGNLTPLCASCHRSLHSTGRRTFEKNHGIELASAAESYYRRWTG
jgi:hypothetical protein